MRTSRSRRTIQLAEIARATADARQEIAREDATVGSATATAGPGRHRVSNIGEPCTSGRLIHVTLIGSFPHIVTTALPPDFTKAHPEARDNTPRAVELTIDALSGLPCQLSVRTGEVHPRPGATVLDAG